MRVFSLLTIEDKFAGAAERVGDLNQGGSGLGGECLSGRPTASGKEEVVLGTGSTDGSHYLLNSVHPGRDRRDVMRLVHDTEDDARLTAIFLRELRPQADELSVCWTSLGDYLSVPASVVVLTQKYVIYNGESGLPRGSIPRQ